MSGNEVIQKHGTIWGRAWLRNQRTIILWSLVAFLALAKFGYFWSRYVSHLDTWQTTRDAIALVQTKESVLASGHIVPHLSHRPLIQSAIPGLKPADLNQYKYILLNLRHPGLGSPPEIGPNLVKQLKQMPQFQLRYQRDDVLVFEKVDSSSSLSQSTEFRFWIYDFGLK